MVIINLQGRNLSLPKTVVKKGVDGWNSQVGDSWIIREMREKVWEEMDMYVYIYIYTYTHMYMYMSSGEPWG